MPAKRKLLPNRCPKCKSHFGTIQIVFFTGIRKKTGKWGGGRHKAVFRVGHYDSERYEQVKKNNEHPLNHASDDEKKMRLRTSQRRWCSFRSDHLEFGELGERYMWRYDMVAKPVTMPITAELWNMVIEEGWRRI